MIQSSIGEARDELRTSLSGPSNPSDQAHVWISSLDVWTREWTDALMSPDELTRARTLRHPMAQQNYLAGRALVRTVLSHYADLEPSTWTFSPSRFGRPEIIGPLPIPELRFNLTHTPGLAACVVTATANCGIDVEDLERALEPLRIAKHSYAPEEFRDLEHLALPELRERFFSYWTLKESYYKARGSGIPFRLGGARFELVGDDAVLFAPGEDERTRGEGWQFQIYRPTTQHVLAIAIESGDRRPMEVRCFGNSSNGAATAFAQLDLSAARTTETVNV